MLGERDTVLRMVIGQARPVTCQAVTDLSVLEHGGRKWLYISALLRPLYPPNKRPTFPYKEHGAYMGKK